MVAFGNEGAASNQGSLVGAALVWVEWTFCFFLRPAPRTTPHILGQDKFEEKMKKGFGWLFIFKEKK